MDGNELTRNACKTDTVLNTAVVDLGINFIKEETEKHTYMILGLISRKESGDWDVSTCDIVG